MIFELSRENEIKKAFKCHVLDTRPLKHTEENNYYWVSVWIQNL